MQIQPFYNFSGLIDILMIELLPNIQNTDWAYGAFVFAARVTDVSLGTLRTIAIVHGRTLMSFWLGFFESAIWLVVVSTIVQTVSEQPALGIIYALGVCDRKSRRDQG